MALYIASLPASERNVFYRKVDFFLQSDNFGQKQKNTHASGMKTARVFLITVVSEL